MSANLIGFVLGPEGTRYLVEQIVATWRGPCAPYIPCGSEAIELPWRHTGRGFVVLALPGLYIAVQVMFEYRSVLCYPCVTVAKSYPFHSQ
jgi:hypothetical protein